MSGNCISYIDNTDIDSKLCYKRICYKTKHEKDKIWSFEFFLQNEICCCSPITTHLNFMGRWCTLSIGAKMYKESTADVGRTQR